MKTFREIAEMHYATEPTNEFDKWYRERRINALEKLLTEQLCKHDVSGSVIDKTKVAFFGQFDNDEPFEIMIGFGKEITLKMQPYNGTIEFTCTESGKRFKMFVKIIN